MQARLITAAEAHLAAAMPIFPEADRATGLNLTGSAIQCIADAEKVLGRAGLRVSRAARSGGAKHLLLDEAGAWGADCIFVGSRGLGAVGRLLLEARKRGWIERLHPLPMRDGAGFYVALAGKPESEERPA